MDSDEAGGGGGVTSASLGGLYGQSAYNICESITQVPMSYNVTVLCGCRFNLKDILKRPSCLHCYAWDATKI